MGIRQIVDEHRRWVTLGVVLVITGSVLFALWYSGRQPADSFARHEFFSEDDGVTWFVDSGTKIAPFDHNGKQAVLARIFKCRNGKMFVGYLEKFSDEARKQIETAPTGAPRHAGPNKTDGAVQFSGIMLKRPHGGEWVRDDDPAAKDVKKFSCPDGGTDFEPVPP